MSAKFKGNRRSSKRDSKPTLRSEEQLAPEIFATTLLQDWQIMSFSKLPQKEAFVTAKDSIEQENIALVLRTIGVSLDCINRTSRYILQSVMLL